MGEYSLDYKKEEEGNKQLFLATQLYKSGFYGREYYDELVTLTKDTEMEEYTAKFAADIKDIEVLTLDKILDINSNIFDDIRLKVIIRRILESSDPKLHLKALHKKIFYMVANEQIQEEQITELADVMLNALYV